MEAERFLMSKWTRAQARKELQLPDDAYVIGVLGRLDPKKGQNLVVRALAELRRKGDANYHVVLMGNATINEGDEFTRQLMDIIRLQDYVHFRPHMDDVMVFFRAVDLFAMPSHGETFGMVTIEAMAAGVPVVGTDKDGTRELLGEGRFGYLFQKEDVADFCRQVAVVRSGVGIGEKLRAARETALTIYSKEKMVDAIDALLLELVEAPVE
jgi:D-inositol-3-phosphate glycosyltransferase